jgi:N-acetylmuramoyl-L-alanine amidase
MPALLLEVGFITNPGDAELMADNPALIARGIYNGILTYFGE